jgi:outer membrane receptor protein involved in Fe transport
VRIGQRDQRGFDTVLAGKFDVRKELNLTLPVSLKTGLLFQQQRRKFWDLNRRWDYAGADGILGNADDSQNIAQFAETQGLTKDIEEHYFPGRRFVWPSVYSVARNKWDNPQLWDEDVAFGAQSRFGSLRLITEKIGAAYVMGNVRFNNKLSVLTGVRFEETRVNGEGPLNYLSPEERARRAAFVGPVTDAEAVRRAEAQFGNRQTSSGKYHTVLPGCI